ncbi:MAG: DUF465 domain-containing protein [Nitrospinota bacterium]|nr:MAG: DUF465 domain-containing protein [Nitrospinota bacterium]
MKDEDPILIEQLRRENEEFNRLWREHQAYEEQLEAFNKLRYLTSEQEIEKKRIQKLKLLGKDRMAAILRQYKASRQPT